MVYINLKMSIEEWVNKAVLVLLLLVICLRLGNSSQHRGQWSL